MPDVELDRDLVLLLAASPRCRLSSVAAVTTEAAGAAGRASKQQSREDLSLDAREERMVLGVSQRPSRRLSPLRQQL